MPNSRYKSAISLNPNSTSIVKSFETSAIFTVSSFQYLTLAYTFSKGPPYRQSILKNSLQLYILYLEIISNLYSFLYYIYIR